MMNIRRLHHSASAQAITLLFFAIGWTLVGCAQTGYVVQAACGQLDIAFARRPLNEAIEAGDLPEKTGVLLSRVASIKSFAERQGLRSTDNYTDYAELNRKAAVWVVSASDPLQFRLKSWYFPIVGSVTYLGWFSRADADRFARELRGEGLDVDVRPASAYSTLGFFNDPILSTMIDEGEGALGELANVVLHESVHATFYMPGQTVLNESVANFIGDILAERYLKETYGENSIELIAYLENEENQKKRTQAMTIAYRRLARLYASALSDSEKRLEKKRIFDALVLEIHSRRTLNNASLAQFKVYRSGNQELQALLDACGGDISRMLVALQTLRPETFSRDQQRDIGAAIKSLAVSGCKVKIE